VCGRLIHELTKDPRSAREGRDLVGAICREWQLGEICDDLVLPVSELVTNALLHAGTTIGLTVFLNKDYVEVAVRDHHPRRPVVRPVRLDLDADIAELAADDDLPEDARAIELHVGDAGSIAAGRGLHIVDAVADEWGVAELAGGKDVWFRVATPAGWRPKEPCPCPQSTTSTPGGISHSVSESYTRP